MPGSAANAQVLCLPAAAASVVRPTIDPNVLRKLRSILSRRTSCVVSTPPTSDGQTSHPEHEAIFSDLQELRAAGLVEPTGGEKHLYWAAMRRKDATYSLGKFYWQMVSGTEYESWYHGPPGPGNVWQYRLG